MRAPARPRFVVTSLTGFEVDGPSVTTFYVLDRAYGYRIVGGFAGRDADVLAARLAARRNGEHLERLRELGVQA